MMPAMAIPVAIGLGGAILKHEHEWRSVNRNPTPYLPYTARPEPKGACGYCRTGEHRGTNCKNCGAPLEVR